MAEIRKFDTGADRDVDTHKPDPEGFLSPLAIRSYNKYMHAKRLRNDGTWRDSDNWQLGFPQDSLVKSMWRHFLDVWTLHRGYPCEDYDGNAVDMEEALAALLFNVQALLHETVKAKADEGKVNEKLIEALVKKPVVFADEVVTRAPNHCFHGVRTSQFCPSCADVCL